VSVYLDASAVAKLVVAEPESEGLASWLRDARASGSDAMSSVLLETELRRLAWRVGIDQTAVTTVLDRLELVDVDRSLFREAGLLAGRHLRSLDALHVAVAIRVDADVFVSYDDRQADAAAAVGLRVLAPT
jgi:predicted nucleic acid-binding protein